MKTILQSHLGELAALGTAVCWTLNAIAFESAGKRVGSLSVNYIRLLIAFILLSITSFFARGLVLPVDATGHVWFWLSISGLIGFVLGDIFLFEAFVQIGSRISLLIMSAAPPIAALAGFLIMGERITALNLVGMFLTMIGISLVILSKNPGGEKIKLNRPIKGLIYASLGALGQAFGLIFSKYGMGSYSPLGAVQVRQIAAIITFTVIITVRKKWSEIRVAFNHKQALGAIAIGAMLGPFIGVTLSLIALQHTAAGIVSSLTSVSPVLIIPLSVGVFKENVQPREILGAVISISGIILLFV